MAKSKSVPAYDGAKFNAFGFCVAHSDVRLSKVTPEGTYKVVRKICPKCGSASLANRGHGKKTTSRGHSHKMKHVPPPTLPPPPLAAVDGRVSERAAKKPEHRDRNCPPARRTERRNSLNRLVEAYRSSRRSKSPAKKETDQRRGLTTSTNPNVEPLSSSEFAKKKLTNKKVNEMMDLMPPLYSKLTTKAAPSRKGGQPDDVKSGPGNKSSSRPFDANGYCRAHPTVRLAQKNGEGQWQIVSGVCPQCCASAVLACMQDEATPPIVPAPPATIKLPSRSTHTNPFDDLIGKKIHGPRTSDDSQQTHPTATSSSCPATPVSVKSKLTFSLPPTPNSPAFSDKYFTAANRGILGLALDIEESERMADTSGAKKNGSVLGKWNESCVSWATEKGGNVAEEEEGKKRDPLPYKEPPGRRLS